MLHSSQIPQVVCYRGSAISYQIAKRIIKTEYISLVNLIMDSPVVTELIQNDLNINNLKIELDKIIEDTYRSNLLENYSILEQKLGGIGASEKAATLIVQETQKK